MLACIADICLFRQISQLAVFGHCITTPLPLTINYMCTARCEYAVQLVRTLNMCLLIVLLWSLNWDTRLYCTSAYKLHKYTTYYCLLIFTAHCTPHPHTHTGLYRPFALPSAGTLPFLQTLICERPDNNDGNEQYRDLPRYPGAPWVTSKHTTKHFTPSFSVLRHRGLPLSLYLKGTKQQLCILFLL